nr:hypothetical protein [Tanacetum cinerariifolium]
MTSSSKTSSPNFKRKTARISVKYPTYVNLTSSSKEHPNEKTPSQPPRKKSLSPPQAPSKFISSKSTHYTSSLYPTQSWVCSKQTNVYLQLRLMRLAKKVRGIVKASKSFRGKLVKTIEEEASCCRTSCIYQGEEDQSFSIRYSSESKMACVKWDRVLVVELIDGEQFVTEEIIEEGNRWPNIEVRITWDRKIIRAASSSGGTIAVYEY